MGASAARRASLILAWQLRVLSALQLLAGAGYIAFACVLQFPPGDMLTAGLWVIGVLTILSSLAGFVAGCQVRCCMGIFTTLAALATMAQTGFVLYLFIAPDQAIQKLSDYQNVKGKLKQNLDEIVNIGRWVLLGLLGAQLLALVLALALKCCTKRSKRYEEFEDEEYERHRSEADMQLDKLKSKVLSAEQQQKQPGSKTVVSLTAVSGSAAAQVQHQQQHIEAMRSKTVRTSLFSDADDKLDEEMGFKICANRNSSEVPNMQLAPSAKQPPPSAWPAAAQAAPQPRSFHATWSSKIAQQ